MHLIAHRMPPTPEGCRRLHEAGADIFEADVQLGPRGMIVSHYATVPRTAGRLQRDGWRLRWGTVDGRDPMLAALAAALPDGARLLLDPKERVDRDALIDSIIATFPHPGDVVVSTSRRQDLDRLRAAGFGTWVSIGDRGSLQRAFDGTELPYDGVTVRHTLLDAATVRRLLGRVPLVVAWTVNGVDRARELAGFGVGGVTTDRAAVMTALRRA